MNSVSWFIYLAEIASNFGQMFAFLIFFSLVVFVPGFVMCLLNTDSQSARDQQRYSDFNKNGRVMAKAAASVAICTFLIGALIPSKGALYAIAASQVGEHVVKSEAVQGMANEASQALQQWIKKQIEPEAKAKKDDKK